MLGTVRADGSPQLTVVWYELNDEWILINSRRGREKDRNIASDARVALCVEDGERFVSIDGLILEAIDDTAAALADILRLGVRYDGEAAARRQYDERWSKQRRVSYRMSIDRVHVRGFP